MESSKHFKFSHLDVKDAKFFACKSIGYGFRRQLSMTAAKAYSACLIDSVSRVGEGHRMAGKRRAWVKREEERMEVERRAYWHAYVRSWGKARGQFTV